MCMYVGNTTLPGRGKEKERDGKCFHALRKSTRVQSTYVRVWDAMGQIGGDLHSCLDSDDGSLGSNKEKKSLAVSSLAIW